MRPSKWLLIAAGVIFLVSHAYASNVPLDDPGYDVLRRLEAEGIVESSILTTLPLSRQEIVRLIREAEKNAGSESGFIQQQIEFLKARFRDDIEAKKYIKPLGALSGKYIYSDQDDPAIVYNNDGDIYAKGSNIRAGLSSWAEFGWFSYFINPELRYDEGDTDLILKNGYGVIHVLGLDLEAGKESQWWGPGYHGSLLLSNNAEPFTLVRLSNTNPVLLPWIFKYLGPLRFTAFATMLEEDRDFSHPYLWGMKINFKPLPY
ncbi:MAG: capsule assembly Wzi family protein, partial [bacterium]